MRSDRVLFVLGSVLAGIAVAAGAFGAHGLRGKIDPALLEAFTTGARYQMSHGLALLAVAWASTRWPSARVELAGWLLAAGTVVFSGSLYLMALSGLGGLGAVTPVGGVLLLIGWGVLGWRVATRGSQTGA